MKPMENKRKRELEVIFSSRNRIIMNGEFDKIDLLNNPTLSKMLTGFDKRRKVYITLTQDWTNENN